MSCSSHLRGDQRTTSCPQPPTPCLHSPAWTEGSGAAGAVPSHSRIPGAGRGHGQGLTDSLPLAGAGEGEEEEDEAEVEERQTRGLQGCEARSEPGLADLAPQARGSPKGSGEGTSRGAGALGQRVRHRPPTVESSQAQPAPGPLNTAKAGGSRGRPPGLPGRGSQALWASAGAAAGTVRRSSGKVGESLDVCRERGLWGVPGRGVQGRESGEGPVTGCDGESSPESSTFSGDEEEKGEGLEVRT